VDAYPEMLDVLVGVLATNDVPIQLVMHVVTGVDGQVTAVVQHHAVLVYKQELVLAMEEKLDNQDVSEMHRKANRVMAVVVCTACGHFGHYVPLAVVVE